MTRPLPPIDLTGHRLGKYDLLGRLGHGGMATVYRAYDRDLDREVALKVLSPQLAMDPLIVDRFLHAEARTAGSLDHDHIVRVHNVGQIDGYYIMDQELIDGASLDTIVAKQSPLPLKRVVSIVDQVASALDAAHQRGLIHRDVKSANILVGPGDRVKLTDFGLVRVLEGTRFTRRTDAVGTPEYMSPEQAQGDAVTTATDVYGLGVVTYEMLTGRTPFAGRPDTAVIVAHMREQPKPIRVANPRVPPAVEQVVMKALAKSPEQRFASPAAFAQALEKAAGMAGRADGQRRPNPAGLLAIASAALVLVLAIAWLLQRGVDGPLAAADATREAAVATSVAAATAYAESQRRDDAAQQQRSRATATGAAVAVFTAEAASTALVSGYATQTAERELRDGSTAQALIPRTTASVLELLEPAALAKVGSCVDFVWRASPGLEEGERFDLRVCYDGMDPGCRPEFGIAAPQQAPELRGWNPVKRLDDQRPGGLGFYRWQVVVVDATRSVLRQSPVASFEFTGGCQ